MSHQKHFNFKQYLESDRRYLALRLKAPCYERGLAELIKTLEEMLSVGVDVALPQQPSDYQAPAPTH